MMKWIPDGYNNAFAPYISCFAFCEFVISQTYKAPIMFPDTKRYCTTIIKTYIYARNGQTASSLWTQLPVCHVSPVGSGHTDKASHRCEHVYVFPGGSAE